MLTQFDLYNGKPSGHLPDLSLNKTLNNPALYKPSEALQNAVNVAILLGKPLLITGEPGTGKTQLAHNVAYSFELPKPLTFNTKSTSTATDLFYIYDGIKHLQYSQMKDATLLSSDEVEELFIKYQALGKAIKSQKRQVVLIDEIDKAPRDLPNDILNVLEEMSFYVPEIRKEYRSKVAKRPIVILTSNSEKNLPDAFLRRCIYVHLQFPSEEELMAIITGKLSMGFYKQADLEDYIIPHFLFIRNTLKKKKPSVSEFLHWVTLLEKLSFRASSLEKFKKLPLEEKSTLFYTYSVLAKTEEDVNLIRQIMDI